MIINFYIHLFHLIISIWNHFMPGPTSQFKLISYLIADELIIGLDIYN